MRRPGWKASGSAVLAAAALTGVVTVAALSLHPAHPDGTGTSVTQQSSTKDHAGQAPAPRCTSQLPSSGAGAGDPVSPDEASPVQASAPPPAGSDVGAGLLPHQPPAADGGDDIDGTDDAGTDGLGDVGSDPDPADTAAGPTSAPTPARC